MKLLTWQWFDTVGKNSVCDTPGLHKNSRRCREQNLPQISVFDSCGTHSSEFTRKRQAQERCTINSLLARVETNMTTTHHTIAFWPWQEEEDGKRQKQAWVDNSFAPLISYEIRSLKEMAAGLVSESFLKRAVLTGACFNAAEIFSPASDLKIC